MKSQPTCIKCGRKLKSPVSIARGMGPKCAGGSSKSGKKVRIRIRRSYGVESTSLTSHHAQVPLFHGDVSEEHLNNQNKIASLTKGKV